MSWKNNGVWSPPDRLNAVGRMMRAAQPKSRGQAAVEFALVLTVAMIVLFVAVQMALIGQVALALGQMNYQGARYAAINLGCTDATSSCGGLQSVTSYMQSVASPTINFSGLKATMLCGNPPTSSACASRAQGDAVQISVTYDCTSNLVLPKTFLGITFPTSLQSSETAMSE